MIFLSCWNAPAINIKYDFSQINNIKLKKITDHSYKPGSGQIMEDNLSFMFMKHGYDVSQNEKNGTIINLNEIDSFKTWRESMEFGKQVYWLERC